MNPVLEEIYSTIIPSMPFIVAAYVLIWVIVLVWLLLQFNKQRKLDQRLTLIEEELDARKQQQS